MTPISLTAPAKLNLFLRLTGVQRADGRHELVSHFAPLTLVDILHVTPATKFALDISGQFAEGVPTDQRNLVWQVFDGFGRAFGPQKPLNIHIVKNIPHGAGLGGGSSDAGALLRYLAHQAEVPLDEVIDWSLSLGADMPAAVRPHGGLVRGVGEILGQTLPSPDQDVLLVKPIQNCATAQVFQAWQGISTPPPSTNDLEAAAISLCPDIGHILRILRTHLDPAAQMTGSGSACFALVPHRWRLSEELKEDLKPYWTFLTSFV